MPVMREKYARPPNDREEVEEMALVSCYECGSMISDRAEACPACGAPYRKKNNMFVGRHFVYFSNGDRVFKIDKHTGKTHWSVRIAVE
jgi:hypothetical protein